MRGLNLNLVPIALFPLLLLCGLQHPMALLLLLEQQRKQPNRTVQIAMMALFRAITMIKVLPYHTKTPRLFSDFFSCLLA